MQSRNADSRAILAAIYANYPSLRTDNISQVSDPSIVTAPTLLQTLNTRASPKIMVGLADNLLAVVIFDSIEIWDMKSQQIIRTLPPDGVKSISALQALSNGLIASGSGMERVRIWNYLTGECIDEYLNAEIAKRKSVRNEATAPVIGFALCADNRLASISLGSDQIDFLNVDTEQQYSIRKKPKCDPGNGMLAIAAFPNKNWLISSYDFFQNGHKSEINIWDVDSKRV
jgi:WD40 repeat protein